MNLPAKTQQTTDEEHLKLLSIFHYVNGGLTAFTCSFALIHVVVGIFTIIAPPPDMPAWFGWLFLVIGSAVVLGGWTLGAMTIYSGRCIRARKRRTFSMIIAGLNCLSVPLGTALGVFTILVLNRPSVRALYQGDYSVPQMDYSAHPFDESSLIDHDEAEWKELEQKAKQSKPQSASMKIDQRENA